MDNLCADIELAALPQQILQLSPLPQQILQPSPLPHSLPSSRPLTHRKSVTTMPRRVSRCRGETEKTSSARLVLIRMGRQEVMT